jgi:hypothetical protein
VSPPSEESRLAALAALSGSGGLAMPEPGPERAVLAADLIGRARRNGATWAAVGEILGLPGPKLAKREARLLANAVAAGRSYPLTRP